MLAGEGKMGYHRGVRPMREAERKRNFLSHKNRRHHKFFAPLERGWQE